EVWDGDFEQPEAFAAALERRSSANSRQGTPRRAARHAATAVAAAAAAAAGARTPSRSTENWDDDFDFGEAPRETKRGVAGGLVAYSRPEEDQGDDYSSDFVGFDDALPTPLAAAQRSQSLDAIEDPFAALPEEAARSSAVCTSSAHSEELVVKLADDLVGACAGGSAAAGPAVESAAAGLVTVLRRRPDLAVVLRKRRRVVQLVALAAAPSAPLEAVAAVLRVLDEAVEASPEVRDHFVLVGGLPVALSRLSCTPATASSTSSAAEATAATVRAAALHVARAVCVAGRQGAEEFLACGGLAAVAGILEAPQPATKSLAGGDSADLQQLQLQRLRTQEQREICRLVTSVVGLQERDARGDVCEELCRLGYVGFLGQSVAAASGAGDRAWVERLAELYVEMSSGSSTVQERLAEDGFAPMAGNLAAMEAPAVTLFVKSIRNLSQRPGAADRLDGARVIEALVRILTKPGKATRAAEGAALQSLFNLCRLSPPRLTRAVRTGAIPVLVRAALPSAGGSGAAPAQQRGLAVPLLCDTLYCHAASKAALWEARAAHAFVALLRDSAWVVNALEALTMWLSHEPDAVEAILVRHADTVAYSLSHATTAAAAESATAEQLLGALHRLVSAAEAATETAASLRVALGRRVGLWGRGVVPLLRSARPAVRLGALRLAAQLLPTVGTTRGVNVGGVGAEAAPALTEVARTVRRLAATDTAVLVREMAARVAPLAAAAAAASVAAGAAAAGGGGGGGGVLGVDANAAGLASASASASSAW
ncbi:hypothetical protein HK405_002964, partial [Cladochytrium tenue]